MGRNWETSVSLFYLKMSYTYSYYLLDYVFELNKNMNILIMGDSWGYSKPNLNDSYLTVENTLLTHGHYVFNKSHFGGSNQWTLAAGESFIHHTNKLFKIDLIIWFFTELTRDWHSVPFENIESYEQWLEKIHNLTYKCVTNIRNITPNTKWAIIGGHAPVYKVADYKWANFLIEDWRSELLNYKLPESQCLLNIEILIKNKKKFGFDTIEKEIEKYETITLATKNRPDIFEDEHHPNNKYNQTLATRILEIFKGD